MAGKYPWPHLLCVWSPKMGAVHTFLLLGAVERTISLKNIISENAVLGLFSPAVVSSCALPAFTFPFLPFWPTVLSSMERTNQIVQLKIVTTLCATSYPLQTAVPGLPCKQTVQFDQSPLIVPLKKDSKFWLKPSWRAAKHSRNPWNQLALWSARSLFSSH